MSHFTVSLRDIMFNFNAFGLCNLMQSLVAMEKDIELRLQIAGASTSSRAHAADLASEEASSALGKVTQSDLSRIRGWLKYSIQLADRLELQGVIDRVDIFNMKLGRLSLQDFVAEIRALREAFDRGITYRHFYSYPNIKAQRILKFEDEWQSAIACYPQIKQDAIAAVDCYALGHNTASVFHSMRVVELGLRDFAAAVNVSFDIQQWQTIIEQIESAIRHLGEHWKPSKTKSDWMKFYSEAAKEFFYFKDGWRNYVSHGGDPYDEHQALGTLEHVRSFMNHLALRFSSTE